MQERIDDWSNTRDRPPREKSRTRSMFFRFLLGVSGFVLLASVALGTIASKSINLPETHAAQRYTRHGLGLIPQNGTSGQVTIKLVPNQQLTIQANISKAPSDTPLVMYVQDESCTGSTLSTTESPLFTLQATSNSTGHAFTRTTLSLDDQDQETTLPSNWFFSVRDTTRQGADGSPLPTACGPIQIDSSGLKGSARLSSVQQEQTADLNQPQQSNAFGLATLQLISGTTPTLSVQATIFGAPSDTTLTMEIHGGSSCTGPTLFTLQPTTSSDTGHASITANFNDSQDSAITTDWFFNVDEQGLDGNTLSIACGPIQPIDSTLAFAKLDPVQDSIPNTLESPTPVQGLPPGDQSPTPVPSTTQTATEGIATLQLNPSTHTLAVEAIVFNAPPNAPLTMEIRGGSSCTGPTLFTPLQATSNSTGNASADQQLTDSQDTTIPSTWFFNVDEQGPNNTLQSIACGPIQITDPSGLTAHALLASQTTVTPETVTTSLTTGPTTQNTARGLAIMYLNPGQTLTMLAYIVGVPPNTPLEMDIHGDGSCTGPTLFLLQTKSNNKGTATAIMPFTDTQDLTIPSSWFFNIDEATQQGNNSLQSIACGPIQAVGEVGLAQLNLFSQPPNPYSQPTTPTTS